MQIASKAFNRRGDIDKNLQGKYTANHNKKRQDPMEYCYSIII